MLETVQIFKEERNMTLKANITHAVVLGGADISSDRRNVKNSYFIVGAHHSASIKKFLEKLIVLDFKFSPCYECRMLASG